MWNVPHRRLRNRVDQLSNALEIFATPPPAVGFLSQDEVDSFVRTREEALAQAVQYAEELKMLIGKLDHRPGIVLPLVMVLLLVLSGHADAAMLDGCGRLDIATFTLDPFAQDLAPVLEYTVHLDQILASDLKRIPRIVTFFIDGTGARRRPDLAGELRGGDRVCVKASRESDLHWRLRAAPALSATR